MYNIDKSRRECVITLKNELVLGVFRYRGDTRDNEQRTQVHFLML